ncbi:hypothetical protein N5D37_03020 [Comamonas aquatica]|uniref:hypothetical protein n=1 Tax=Comamonas aquatica TaxID=225991 RepID=UPI002446D5AE|nr:hypothetical protein [Comamonas aquatica]MDH1764681.1 hypothetical protein [Comamonas aquatica]
MSLISTLRAALSRQLAIYRATHLVAKMYEILEDSGKNAALFKTHAVATLHKLHSMNCEQFEAELETIYQRYVKLKHA